MSHNTGFTTATIALLMRHHLVLMQPVRSGGLPATDQRLPGHLPDDGADHHAAGCCRSITRTPTPTTCRRCAGSGTWARRARRRSSRPGSTCWGPETVWELYGGTELQALTFISGDQWLAHRGSVGIVVAGEMKVLDDDGNACPPGEVGEIYMRPRPGSAPTYRYVGATANPATAGTHWAISATSTPTVSLHLATAGSTCSPSVGATSIRPRSRPRCPSIRMCCPVWSLGCPTKIWDRCPMRWCRPATALVEAAVREFSHERIAGYKVPRTVEFVDTPLRDDAGKARRSAVRAEIMARLRASGIVA